MHRHDIKEQIRERLINEFEMVQKGNYLYGRCPSCGKKELWTWHDSPGVVQCSRLNKCGYSEKTSDLFADLYEDLNDKYKPTETDPNATANAYLDLVRGFDTNAIHGWYEQAHFNHRYADKDTATVRFYLDAEKNIFWERLIDDVTIKQEDGSLKKRNKNFRGSTKGLWWQPPTLVIEEGDEVWLCEGILDAIALNLNGIKACSIMSSMASPDISIAPYLNKNITWVIAADNDKAGRAALNKHVELLTEKGEHVVGALSSESESKADWNDLHKAGKLTEKDIAYYRYIGDLATAKSYKDKASLIWHRNQAKKNFIFTHGHRTYAAKIDSNKYQETYHNGLAATEGRNPGITGTDEFKEIEAKLNKEQLAEIQQYAFQQAASLHEIATFEMHFLYFQQPENGEEGQYFFRFRYANQSPENMQAFPGKVFASASEFKKAALREPSAQFTGSSENLDEMYREFMKTKPKIVKTLDYIGYDKASKTYVFNEYAVQEGRLINLNNESFFEIKKGGIKTLVDIKQTLSTNVNFDWVHDYKTAFGTKGFVVLSWWLGCLFVEQVRDRHRSYPFFELIGEPGSGKSDMVDFLWKLLGKESESFNPNSSTLPGRTRKMSEVSNLPVVFNETDNEQSAVDGHRKRFDWDEQKDLFDGEFGRVTGVKSQDNSTKKPRFKSGLMAVQNIPIQASEAILTRTARLNFDLSHHSAEGKKASDRLNMTSIGQLNGFLIHCILKEASVMKLFEKSFATHMDALRSNEAITLQRIADNHAKLMAFADCLYKLLDGKLSRDDLEDTKSYIVKMAEQRQESLNEDHPTIQTFWSQFDYLDGKNQIDDHLVPASPLLNHHKDTENFIAINLEHFYEECRRYGLPIIDQAELKRQIKSSRTRPFSEYKSLHSATMKRTVRCYIFNRRRK